MKIPYPSAIKIFGLSLVVAGADWLVVFRLLPVALIAHALPRGIFVMPTWGEVVFCLLTAIVGVWILFATAKLLIGSGGRYAWLILLPSVGIGLGVAALDIAIAREASVILQDVGSLNVTNVSENMGTHFWVATLIVFAMAAEILWFRARTSPLCCR